MSIFRKAPQANTFEVIEITDITPSNDDDINEAVVPSNSAIAIEGQHKQVARIINGSTSSEESLQEQGGVVYEVKTDEQDERPVGFLKRISLWIRRHRLIVILGAVALSVGIIVAAVLGALAGTRHLGGSSNSSSQTATATITSIIPVPTSSTSNTAPATTGTAVPSLDYPVTNLTTLTTPAGTHFIYDGCWQDNLTDRTLTGPSYSTGSMTNLACAELCNGYEVFGTEIRDQCFCGKPSEPTHRNTVGLERSCNAACSGNSSEVCGGLLFMSLWVIVNV